MNFGTSCLVYFLCFLTIINLILATRIDNKITELKKLEQLKDIKIITPQSNKTNQILIQNNLNTKKTNLKPTQTLQKAIIL